MANIAVYTRLARKEGSDDITVAYLRLSKEDGDDESVSIANQRRIIDAYAQNNNITIHEYYIDDGFSGYTMSRPAFNRLKQDLNQNKVHTVIVKDLSRVGRHAAKVQLFLENIYEVGKRVITLGENYDTLNKSSHRFVGIQTWVNEDFIRETSEKIRNSVEILQKEGKWLCSIPYGYIKDDNDKYKYYVDKTVAPYVKLIFEKYIEGYGLKTLARMLTEMNIPTPNMVKKMRAEAKGQVYKRKASTQWNNVGVARILNNPFYTGTLVLGKSKKRAINGKSIPVPKDDWYVFEDAHEAIIDKSTYDLVQQITKERAEKDYRGRKQVRPNIFAGILVCSDCGKTLTSNCGRPGNTRYICRTYNTFGTSQCTSHAVSERETKYALLTFLEYCRENLADVISDLDNIIQAEIQTKGSSNDGVLELSNRIEDTKKSIEILIEQKMRETMKNPTMVEMIDKMYDKMLNTKYKEIQILQKQLDDQHHIALDEVEMKKNLNSAMSIMNDILSTQEITKKQVLLLVDKIVVHEDTGIDIYLKGDLHKLCNNYFHVSGSNYDTLKKLTYDFIMQNPSKFTTNEGEVYIRSHGMQISYKRFSKLLKDELVANNLIKIRPMNHGYELIASPEELEAQLIPHNVANIGRSLCSNNEIFAVLFEISEWIESIKYTQQKNLF